MPSGTEAPLRLAIIGAGNAVTGFHARALRRLTGRFTVTVVCSRNLEHARAAAALFGIDAISANAEDVVARRDVDAVLIAVPIFLSAGIAALALNAGKHVLVDKPLAATLQEAQELERASSRRPDLVAMVGENIRYAPTTQQLKKLVWDGEIGTPTIAYCHSIAHIDPSTQADWRARPEHPGGYLLDGGVHFAALLRIVLGEATDVVAVAQISEPLLGGTIGLSVHVHTDRHVQVIYNHLRTPCSAAARSEALDVYGTQGSVALSGQRSITVRSNEAPPRHVVVDNDLGHIAQWEDFFGCIRLHGSPKSSFQEGVEDIRWIHLALESAAKAPLHRVRWAR